MCNINSYCYLYDFASRLINLSLQQVITINKLEFIL